MENAYVTDEVTSPRATAQRTTEPPGERHVDGRTARRDRNRRAVLDAVIELFSEDNLSPGVHEVAQRSGVSLRSVYRYFEDLDALIMAAIERQLDRSRPLFVIDDLGVGPRDERIARFCARRVELFEGIRSVYAASTIRARMDRQVADGLAWARTKLGEQTEAMFEPELSALPADDARMLALTLDVLSQFDTLEHLRGDRRLSVDETVGYLVDAFADILP